MSIIHPLDELIKVVRQDSSKKKAKKKSSKSLYQFVLLEEDGTIFQPKRGFFSKGPDQTELERRRIQAGIWSDWHDMEISLGSITLGLPTLLQFRFKLKIPADKVEQVASSFGRVDTGAYFDQFLEQRIHEWTKRNPIAQIPDFSTYLNQLLEALTKQVKETFHLKFEWETLPGPPPSPNTYDDASYTWEIVFNDYTTPLPVSLKARSHPDLSQPATYAAVEFKKEQVAAELATQVGAYFRTKAVKEYLDSTQTVDPGLMNVIREQFKRIGRHLVYLDLDIRDEFKALAEGGMEKKISVKVQPLGWRRPVEFSLEFKIRAIPSRLHLILKSFQHLDPKANLESFLTELITNEAEQLATSRASFILDFHLHQQKLAEVLRDQLNQQHGLQFQGAFALQGRKEILSGLEIHRDSIRVQCKDIREDIIVETSLGIELNENQRRQALVADLSEEGKKSLVRSTIIETCAQKVTLHELFVTPQATLTKIREALEQELDKRGFRLRHFSIQPQTQLHFETDPPQFDFSQEFFPQGSSNGIVFNSSVILRMRNLADFIRLDVSQLNKWVEKTVRDQTSEVVFEKTNSELILHSGNIIHTIKEKIRTTFQDAGYDVLLHVVEPQNEFADLQRGFVVKSKRDNYTTKNNESEVAMDINIRGEIPDLNAIEKFLQRRDFSVEDFKEMIQGVAEDAVAAVLEEVHAEHFYFYFERPFHRTYEAPRPFEDGTLLKNHLITQIHKALLPDEANKTFGINNLRITIQQNETKIIRRFNSLQSKSHSFKFSLHPPGDADYSEIVTLKAGFGIATVSPDHWHIYKQKCRVNDRETEEIEQQLERIGSDPKQQDEIRKLKRELADLEKQGAAQQIDEIQELMQEVTRSMLEGYDPLEIKNYSPEESMDFKEDLKFHLSDFLKSRTGLVIAFDYIRYKSLSEGKKYKKMLKQVKGHTIKDAGKKRIDDTESRSRILKSLRDKIEKKYLNPDLDEEDIEEIELLKGHYKELSGSDFVAPRRSLRIGGNQPKELKRHSPRDLLKRLNSKREKEQGKLEKGEEPGVEDVDVEEEDS